MKNLNIPLFKKKNSSIDIAMIMQGLIIAALKIFTEGDSQ